MDNDTFVLLSGTATLVFACAICLGVVVIFGGFIFFFVRRGKQFQSAWKDQPEKMGEDYLSAAQLRPWDSSAWADLSCWWDGWWKNLTGVVARGYAHGVVKSLKEPGGPGWLAYTLSRPDLRNGTLVLKSTDWRLDLQIAARGRMDPNVQVQVMRDGAQIAAVTVAYPTHTYRTTDGVTEAVWSGPPNRVYLPRVSGGFLSSKAAAELPSPIFSDVTINGRRVGAIADQWVRKPRPENANPFYPGFKLEVETLSSEEQLALSCVVGMALYYDNLRTRGGPMYYYDL